MTTARGVMVIDSGQTAIKVRLDGQPTRSYPGLRANSSVLPQLAAAVEQAAHHADLATFIVLIGTAGLTPADNDPDELLRLCTPYGAVSVSLAHDAVTCFLGALGSRRGVVVGAGTGSITLGVGAETIARVDGWGNIISDAGGGFWVGRAALDAVYRAFDGRGPATALTAVVQGRYPDLECGYMELLNDPDAVRIVASFAQHVAQLAHIDPIAAEICLQAGRELAHSAATAVARIGEDSQANPVISLIGAILSPGPIRDSCVASLRQRWPAFLPFPAMGTALDGAEALGHLQPTHPLATQVGHAPLAG